MNETERYMSVSTERILEAIVLSLTAFTAFIGNLALWLIVCGEKSLRTPSNVFILSLSAADLMISIVDMPIIVYTIVLEHWPFSEAACKGLGFSAMLTFVASVMNLCTISINRYVHICHPAKLKSIYTMRNVMFFVIGTWALALCLSLPPLMGWCRYGYHSNQSFCFAYWKDSISYTYFMVGICFGGPCSVMTFCYINIFLTHRRSSIRVGVQQNENSTRSRRSSSLTRKRKDRDKETDPAAVAQAVMSEWRKQRAIRRRQDELRLTCSLFVVICVFVICWLPFCITMFMWVHGHQAPRIPDMITLLLGCFNSAANPIIYGVMNRRFRIGYANLFLCRRLRSSVYDSHSGDDTVDKPPTTLRVSVAANIAADEVSV